MSITTTAAKIAADPDKFYADCWHAWWSPAAVQLRAEQHEAEIAARVEAALLLRDGATTEADAAVLKRASIEISISRPRWDDIVCHTELLRRRAKPGPLAGKCGRDREALTRWVATGSSQPQTEAA